MTPSGGLSPVADPRAVVTGSGYRFTVLTSRLVRMECSEDDRFADGRTQAVQNRRFDLPEFTVSESDDSLDIWTEHVHVSYDKGSFTAAGLSVSMRQRVQASHWTTWRYGDSVGWADGGPTNLGGTVRTLDNVDGGVELEPGLLSLHGYAVIDDSHSLQLTDDGWIAPRPGVEEDLYFFGYGREYQVALRETRLQPAWASDRVPRHPRPYLSPSWAASSVGRAPPSVWRRLGT